MTQVHVYGKMADRYDVETIKGLVDTVDVTTALAFRGSQDDDAIEDWIAAMTTKYGATLSSALYCLVADHFQAVDEAKIAQWPTTHTIAACCENGSIAFAPTASAAKIAWVNCEDGVDD